jgi:hypothetical protein
VSSSPFLPDGKEGSNQKRADQQRAELIRNEQNNITEVALELICLAVVVQESRRSMVERVEPTPHLQVVENMCLKSVSCSILAKRWRVCLREVSRLSVSLCLWAMERL